MTSSLAVLYSLLAAATVVFQIALILGAPWGHLTQGGFNKGALPTPARIGAAMSIVLLVIMACSINSAAGLWPAWPAWTSWVALVISGMSLILNLFTPSRAERLLWGPVTAVMFLCALGVMLL